MCTSRTWNVLKIENMHVLDLIMYVVLVILLWQFLRWSGRGEFTEELGSLIGLAIIFVFTIIYVIIFCFYPNLNWADMLPKIWSWRPTLKW